MNTSKKLVSIFAKEETIQDALPVTVKVKAKVKQKSKAKNKLVKNSLLYNEDDMRKCDLVVKKTLHGVKSETTSEMFKELKKRGFNVGLENGGSNTFKIISLINGVDFIISCVDGCSPKYTKSYSRNKRDWTNFNCIDDLIKTTFIRQNNKPTEAQVSFFKTLVSEIAGLSNKKPKIKMPGTVLEMSAAIKTCLSYKNNLKFHSDLLISSEFITVK
jgi:hypothetical protein